MVRRFTIRHPRFEYFGKVCLRSGVHRVISRSDEISKVNMRCLLPENSVIIEAEAHLRYDTIEMKAVWPASVIHCFEPVPKMFAGLKQNTRALEGVTVYLFALGAEAGEAEMFLSDGSSNDSSSILAPKEHLITSPGVTFDEKIKVSVINLAEWAMSLKINLVETYEGTTLYPDFKIMATA